MEVENYTITDFGAHGSTMMIRDKFVTCDNFYLYTDHPRPSDLKIDLYLDGNDYVELMYPDIRDREGIVIFFIVFIKCNFTIKLY